MKISKIFIWISGSIYGAKVYDGLQLRVGKWRHFSFLENFNLFFFYFYFLKFSIFFLFFEIFYFLHFF